MGVRHLLSASALFFIASGILPQTRPPAHELELPPTFVPSGERMYKQFCAACHGSDAKGHGPAASSLEGPPSDLTVLAKRYKGKSPYNYVSSVLHLDPGIALMFRALCQRGGRIFERFDDHSKGPSPAAREIAVRDRIQNLCDYLASLQTE